MHNTMENMYIYRTLSKLRNNYIDIGIKGVMESIKQSYGTGVEFLRDYPLGPVPVSP